jgi:hypothetical protein
MTRCPFYYMSHIDYLLLIYFSLQADAENDAVAGSNDGPTSATEVSFVRIYDVTM